MATKRKIAKPRRSRKSAPKPSEKTAQASECEQALRDAEETVSAARRSLDDILMPFEDVCKEFVFIAREATDETVARWRSEGSGFDFVNERRALAFIEVQDLLCSLHLIEDDLSEARRALHKATHAKVQS